MWRTVVLWQSTFTSFAGNRLLYSLPLANSICVVSYHKQSYSYHERNVRNSFRTVLCCWFLVLPTYHFYIAIMSCQCFVMLSLLVLIIEFCYWFLTLPLSILSMILQNLSHFLTNLSSWFALWHCYQWLFLSNRLKPTESHLLRFGYRHFDILYLAYETKLLYCRL